MRLDICLALIVYVCIACGLLLVVFLIALPLPIAASMVRTRYQIVRRFTVIGLTNDNVNAFDPSKMDSKIRKSLLIVLIAFAAGVVSLSENLYDVSAPYLVEHNDRSVDAVLVAMANFAFAWTLWIPRGKVQVITEQTGQDDDGVRRSLSHRGSS